MIKIQRHAHSGFFQKIIDFANFSFLKFKIDLELNLFKSVFADFVIILEFDGFSSKTCKKYKITQKHYKTSNYNKTKSLTYVNEGV
jgi:hypothetical protein